MNDSKLKFIFVHGLSGWGSYDAVYKSMPYWGMRGGDLIAYLRKEGFDCYAASVAPTGSAWDRACELYAQLAGCRVDYGKAHSREMNHERFGKDFSACPLIEDWNEDTRLVLLGHSFGGATVRLFSELLASGSEAEKEETDPAELSPFFKGGFGSRIASVVTLASPMNGTTAYDLFLDPDFDLKSVKVPWWSKVLAWMMSTGTTPKNKDARDKKDFADYDMHLDNAMEMNRKITTLPHVYYFSLPCSFTKAAKSGRYKPLRGIEPLFWARALQLGAYKGKTRGGFIVDESWRENDGLVNTISAKVPIGAPSKEFDKDAIGPGLWNILPTIEGDHMWPQGGLLRKRSIRPFYLELLGMIRDIL